MECSHSSIGFHYCSPYYMYFDYDELDIVISCYGMYGCACISGNNVSNLANRNECKILRVLAMHELLQKRLNRETDTPMYRLFHCTV